MSISDRIFAKNSKIFEKWYKGKINNVIYSAFRKIFSIQSSVDIEFFEKIRTGSSIFLKRYKESACHADFFKN